MLNCVYNEPISNNFRNFSHSVFCVFLVRDETSSRALAWGFFFSFYFSCTYETLSHFKIMCNNYNLRVQAKFIILASHCLSLINILLSFIFAYWRKHLELRYSNDLYHHNLMHIAWNVTHFSNTLSCILRVPM